jgi:hypothetical protein
LAVARKTGVMSPGFDPFRVGTFWEAHFPGALPPATVWIPCGDQGWTAPRRFWVRQKQVKRLPARSV